MSKIETGRFSDLLRRFLSQKGQEEIASELSPEISAAFILESDRPDWLFLKGERLVGVSTRRTSGATAGPVLRLRNPGGSGVIATLTHVSYQSSVGGLTQVQINDADIDLAGGTMLTGNRDGRQVTSAASAQTALIASFLTAAGAPATELIYQSGPPANVLTVLPSPIAVLSPGTAIDIGSATVAAETMNINIWWHERRISALEAA